MPASLDDLELFYDGPIPPAALALVPVPPVRETTDEEDAAISARIKAAVQAEAAADALIAARAVLDAARRGAGRAQFLTNGGRLETVSVLPHVVARARARLAW